MRLPAEQGVEIDRERVAPDDLDRRRDTGGAERVVEDREQVTVELQRGHLRSRTGERDGERSHAGSDLEHPVAGADAGERDDPARGVGVGEEVLAERPARAQAVRVEEPAQLTGVDRGHATHRGTDRDRHRGSTAALSSRDGRGCGPRTAGGAARTRRARDR